MTDMLFNKDNNGSRELYELTGIFYASTRYESVASEVDHAVSVVSDLVGADVMKKAEEEYAKETPDDAHFLSLVRMPVACLAVCNFSKANLVSHEDTGRKIKVDDNEKVPFSWMIDRDDREQMERYYRAMDSLYSYLVESWPDWSRSPLRSGCLVRALDQLEAVFPVDRSYYCFHMLLPLIMSVQRRKLVKLVGTDGIAAALEKPDAAMSELLREYAVLGALKTAVQRWSLDVFPLSVARRFAPSYQGNRESKAATTDEIDWYLLKLSTQMEDTEAEIVEMMSGGRNPYEDFPLLPENDPRKKYFTTQ